MIVFNGIYELIHYAIGMHQNGSRLEFTGAHLRKIKGKTCKADNLPVRWRWRR